MRYNNICVLAALSRLPSLGSAQILSYVTSVVTECYDESETYELAATTATSAQLPQGTVAYNMPECAECGCPTCTFTSIFTATLPIFCSSGLSTQIYTVTENYAGMSTLPTFATPTTVPYGFTVSEHTCTVCGTTPLVASMTYPSSCLPYDTGIASAASSTAARTAAGSEAQQTVEDSGTETGSEVQPTASLDNDTEEDSGTETGSEVQPTASLDNDTDEDSGTATIYATLYTTFTTVSLSAYEGNPTTTTTSQGSASKVPSSTGPVLYTGGASTTTIPLLPFVLTLFAIISQILPCMN